MKCAIYARKSTEDHQHASLEVQISEAKRWIAAKGWTVTDDHIYVDSGVSRAEFKKRGGLIAMLVAAGRSDFAVVVTRDESRLGGDMFRVGLAIQQLVESRVRLFYYFANEEVHAGSAMDKFMIAASSLSSTLEREKLVGRVKEHLTRKAERGCNVGGRVYGYNNVPVTLAEHRVQVDYAVNAEQAAIVREMFQRYAEGDGLGTIVKDLNARGVPSPRAGKRGTGSWSRSCLREMLCRPRYRGELIWGEIGSEYRDGTKLRIVRPMEERTRVVREDLRIVPEDLWLRVQARFSKNKRFAGARGRRGPAKYMLSGHAKCAQCGGSVYVGNSKSGRTTIRVYACSWNKERGASVCSNNVRRPVADVDASVIAWIEKNILSEALIVETLGEIRRRLNARTGQSGATIPPLEKEAAKLTREITNYTRALATTDVPPRAIVAAITEREKRLDDVNAELAAARRAPAAIEREAADLEARAKARVREFRAVMQRNPEGAHKVLDALLSEPLRVAPVVTPEGRRFQLSAKIAVGSLFLTESDPNGI